MKRDPKTGAPDFYTFARDYLHTYLPTVARRSPKTIEAYRISLECFLDYLADHQRMERAHVSFDHFDRDHLKAWLAWMSDQRHYAARTIALCLSAVKAFLTYCSGEDVTLVALSQAAKALRAPVSARKPIEYLTELETRAVLAAFTGRTAKSRRNRMLLILLYDTAARVGEITSLRLQDLCLHPPGHVRLTGKADKTRVVPLTAKTIEHLGVYLAEFHPNTATLPARRPVFYSLHHGKPTPISTDTSRRCSRLPPRPRAGAVLEFPRTSTATCCARPRPWTSTSKGSRCRSSCDCSATRTYRHSGVLRLRHRGHDARSRQRSYSRDQLAIRTTHRRQTPSPLQPPIAPRR
jgi:site-specific recombinase XerD